jgi:serine/arginine repetitive matrix protein 2
MPVKESPPSRAPDPEHLKALWSQTPSNKNGASMQPVNSLKNINDDLPVIPFTLQEVKSEDGGTPPPASSQSNTARTSFDVRSAFQQVPTSSSSSVSLRPTISPPSTNAPVARPAPNATTSSFTPTSSTPSSHPNQTVPRPPYPTYPMGHSPSPVMYASHPMPSGPMQNRMPVNGPPTPMYGAPMWVPVPAGHQGGPAGIMRPVPSPYPTPMMPYPHGQPQYFAAHMPPPPQNMPPNSQNGPQNQPGARERGPSVSSGSAVPPVMMSPAMQHAHPVPMHPGMTMYANSPMPMHMSPMQAHAQPVPQQHSHFQPPSNGQQGSQPHIPYQPMQPGFPPRSAW